MPPGMVPGPAPHRKSDAHLGSFFFSPLAYRQAERFPSLDGLRCLSIVPVIWHHATPGPLPGVLGKGPVGVDLFFAISGFLITTLMLRERDAAGRYRSAASTRAARCASSRSTTRCSASTWRAPGSCLPPRPERAHFFVQPAVLGDVHGELVRRFRRPAPRPLRLRLVARHRGAVLSGVAVDRARDARRFGLPVAAAIVLLVADQSVEHGLLPERAAAGEPGAAR